MSFLDVLFQVINIIRQNVTEFESEIRSRHLISNVYYTTVSPQWTHRPMTYKRRNIPVMSSKSDVKHLLATGVYRSTEVAHIKHILWHRPYEFKQPNGRHIA